MLKFALEFHGISIMYTMGVIFAGIYRYNLPKLKDGRCTSAELFFTSLALTLIPLVNIGIAARMIMYFIFGAGVKNETK